jgi:transcriptional regulator with XRE-family HTH domain
MTASTILERRRALGWSQRELARRADLRAATICEIENGKREPHASTLKAIEAALKAGECGREDKAS